MCALDTTPSLATAQKTNQTPKAKPLQEVKEFEVGEGYGRCRGILNLNFELQQPAESGRSPLWV